MGAAQQSILTMKPLKLRIIMQFPDDSELFLKAARLPGRLNFC